MKEEASKHAFRDLETTMIARHLSDDTISAYLYGVKLLFDFYPDKEHPTHINDREIEEFIAWINTNRSVNQGRACYWAIRFAYRNSFQQPHKMERLKPPKVSRRLFVPLNPEAILKAIDGIKDIKHKAIVQLLYSTGARRSEAANIKIGDIITEYGVIIIHEGKGDKDGLVPLHPELLKTLREYIVTVLKEYRTPESYLFRGDRIPSFHISKSTIGRICKNYVGVSPHKLRHAFATAVYGQTKDVEAVRLLLRHKNIATTDRYISIDPFAITKMWNTLDQSVQSNLRAA